MKAKYVYLTSFKLLCPVVDLKRAKRFLKRDKMTPYFYGAYEIPLATKKKVKEIKWVLDTDQEGHIELKCFDTLSEKELASISKWVLGQNSDGLGEIFEQMPFAYYKDPKGTAQIASFDWRTNPYNFTLKA